VEFKRKSENTEARREHCQDCVYFRVRGCLEGIVDDLSRTIIRDRFYKGASLLPSGVQKLQQRKMFRKELLKHVDYGNNHRKLLNNLKTVFPGRTFVDNPEFMGSSQGDGHQGGWRETISGRILKHIKVINSQIRSGGEGLGWLALDIANPYTPSLYRYTYGVGQGLGDTGGLHFGELCSVIRSDEHVNRDQFVKGLTTGKWSHIHKKKKYPPKLAAYGGYNLSDFRLYEKTKTAQRMKKKINKKDSFKFKKKNYQSTVNRRRSRKRGISSMHRVTNKYKP
jgi:hypothetical protein